MENGGEFLGLSNELWVGAILGAALSAFGAVLLEFSRGLWRWWLRQRPSWLILERLGERSEPVLVFYRDLWPPVGALFNTFEPLVNRPGVIPNIDKVWPHAEATALANLLYVFAVVDKHENLVLQPMSKDDGAWDAGIVILGAQTERCFQFYEQMESVAFRMTRDGNDIVDNTTAEKVKREPDYGYGIIIKTRNPHRTIGGRGVGLLIGGYGVLGTEAAGHWFRNHYGELAKDFGSRAFGVVVRAPVAGGAEAAVRLPEYDRAMEPKSRLRRALELLPLIHRQV